MFITIEGIEGVGKSTCVDYVSQYLRQRDKAVCVTREPGGTEIAEHIRRVLLASHEEVMTDDTELLLMFACRAQHIAQVIKPALAAGQWVICDRFTDASYAYQGAGRGIDVPRIAALENWVQADFRPDLTLLLDAPLDIALSRMKRRSTPDRIESEQEEFFQRVRDGYLMRAQQYPKQFRLVDAGVTLDEVQIQLRQIVDAYL